MSDATNPATTTDTTVDAATTAAVANTDPATATAPGTGEGQGDAGKTADAGTEGAAPEGTEPVEAEGAPEAYEAFTVPEGFALEGERLADVQEFAKTNNWTQAQAQAAVDKFTGYLAQNAEAESTAVNARIEEWGQQSRDTFGTQYDDTVTHARKAVAAVKSEALDEAFNSQGWGNHPELLRAFAHFGKLLGDSGMNGLGGGTSGGQPVPIESRMYPGMAPK